MAHNAATAVQLHGQDGRFLFSHSERGDFATASAAA